MRSKLVLTAAAAISLVTVISACSSSSSSPAATGGQSSAAAPTTIKIGVITDLTGPFASGFLSTEKGIKAYAEGANAIGGVNGIKLSYVMADSTSSGPGALIAAQKLVQTDHVFAIVMDSAVFYGAEPYLLKAGVPVIGGGFDGPEWVDKANTNLFASTGVNDYDKVALATGLYMKARGVTSCGSIGYANPSSAKGAIGIIKSCEAAGLKKGYLNTQVPPGSTDIGAIAIAIKNAGVDGLDLPVVPNTAFALVARLQQLGVKLKSILLATGYGGDLLESSAAVTAAQGYEFSTIGQPVELKTPATEKLVANLARVGVTSSPTFAEQEAYLAMSAVAAGLKAAGANPTQASFMTALRGIKDFDAEGLLAPNKVDFSNYSPSYGCAYAVQLQGKKFVPVPGTPVCGSVV